MEKNKKKDKEQITQYKSLFSIHSWFIIFVVVIFAPTVKKKVYKDLFKAPLEQGSSNH